MSAICPSSEVDEVAICLLTVFEQRGLAFELFEALIKQEVEETGKILAISATVAKKMARLMFSRKRVGAASSHLGTNQDALRVCQMEGSPVFEGYATEGPREAHADIPGPGS